MKKSLIQKIGAYVIDVVFVLGSIAFVLDFYIRDANHTAAFALVALYALVVIQRFRYVRKQHTEEIENFIDGMD